MESYIIYSVECGFSNCGTRNATGTPTSVYQCAALNPLAPELFFFILAHTVYKMWITQELNKLALWNKLHFEEKKRRV